MRNNSNLVICFLVCTAILLGARPSAAAEQWTTVSADVVTCQGINFVTESTGYLLVGDASLRPGLSLTTDGGATVTEVDLSNLGGGLVLGTAHFFDANKGVATAEGQTYDGSFRIKTTADGGRTWAESYYATGVMKGFYPRPVLQFVDDQVGFATYSTADVDLVGLQTADGGQTWTALNLDNWPGAGEDENAIEYREIQFATREAWFANWKGDLMRTADAGASWTKIANASDNFRFFDGQQGISGTSWTKDGGQTWNEITFTFTTVEDPQNFDVYHVDRVSFADASNVLMAIRGGNGHIIQIVRSTDGGESFTDDEIPEEYRIQEMWGCLQFVSPTVAYAASGSSSTTAQQKLIRWGTPKADEVTGGDGDADSDADSDTDGDADSDVDGDTDGDADSDVDGDADGDADTDADGDGDVIGGVDGGTEADGDDGGDDGGCSAAGPGAPSSGLSSLLFLVALTLLRRRS